MQEVSWGKLPLLVCDRYNWYLHGTTIRTLVARMQDCKWSIGHVNGDVKIDVLLMLVLWLCKKFFMSFAAEYHNIED